MGSQAPANAAARAPVDPWPVNDGIDDGRWGAWRIQAQSAGAPDALIARIRQIASSPTERRMYSIKWHLEQWVDAVMAGKQQAASALQARLQLLFRSKELQGCAMATARELLCAHYWSWAQEWLPQGLWTEVLGTAERHVYVFANDQLTQGDVSLLTFSLLGADSEERQQENVDMCLKAMERWSKQCDPWMVEVLQRKIVRKHGPGAVQAASTSSGSSDAAAQPPQPAAAFAAKHKTTWEQVAVEAAAKGVPQAVLERVTQLSQGPVGRVLSFCLDKNAYKWFEAQCTGNTQLMDAAAGCLRHIEGSKGLQGKALAWAQEDLRRVLLRSVDVAAAKGRDVSQLLDARARQYDNMDVQHLLRVAACMHSASTAEEQELCALLYASSEIAAAAARQDSALVQSLQGKLAQSVAAATRRKAAEKAAAEARERQREQARMASGRKQPRGVMGFLKAAAAEMDKAPEERDPDLQLPSMEDIDRKHAYITQVSEFYEAKIAGLKEQLKARPSKKAKTAAAAAAAPSKPAKPPAPAAAAAAVVAAASPSQPADLPSSSPPQAQVAVQALLQPPLPKPAAKVEPSVPAPEVKPAPALAAAVQRQPVKSVPPEQPKAAPSTDTVASTSQSAAHAGPAHASGTVAAPSALLARSGLPVKVQAAAGTDKNVKKRPQGLGFASMLTAKGMLLNKPLEQREGPAVKIGQQHPAGPSKDGPHQKQKTG
uniref:Uncharacterized protein n=1 Tax=Chlamydomonas leiostraca TaxID=1034604 RepID=A0A7S0RVI8_9CHLO|mmetsp:Transcript_328/g.838  ORF Transcript_328/g.838 Transcript_328/m.838 type:complete len:714 (+) Transcript_328:147-2288(+)